MPVVFVDASRRLERITLGFWFESGVHHARWSTDCLQHSNMDAAEREAVALAQTIYPGLLVYTDNKQAGGTLIPREQNGNAHRTASMRKNFIERKLIEAWMRNPERPFHIQFDIKEVT